MKRQTKRTYCKRGICSLAAGRPLALALPFAHGLMKMTLLSSCIHLASDFALVLLFRSLNGSSTERQYILAITLFTMQEACT